MLWCTLAPLEIRLKSPLPQVGVEIGAGVRLIWTPTWARHGNVLQELSRPQRARLLESAPHAFEVRYDADALGAPDPEYPHRSIQEAAEERLLLATLGVWVAHPGGAAYELLLEAQQDQSTWLLRRLATLPRLAILPEEETAAASMTDLHQAQVLTDALSTIRRGSALWIGVRFLPRALTEPNWDIRYPLLWIVLEALFGPDNATELSFRLCQRLALFLETGLTEREELFRQARQAYTFRSKLVHGKGIGHIKPEQSAELVRKTEHWIRSSLRKILSEPDLVGTFSGKGRDESLDQQALR